MEPGHPLPQVMLLYNNVAQLRQFVGAIFTQSCGIGRLSGRRELLELVRTSAPAGAIDLNLEIANFLAQRIAIDAEEVGGTDLIAVGRRQRGRQ
jgi:hypothetical protein